MPGVPSAMYLNTLNPLKGWPSPTAVDFTGKISANVTVKPVNAGRVVHVSSILNNVPQLELGCVGPQMAIFLFQSSLDFDVTNPGVTGDYTYGISPKGISSGLVACGAYELETTEFDQTRQYLPNQPLRSPASNTDAVNGGILTNQGIGVNASATYANAICGVVSRGVYKNAYGQQALAFWPVYLPHPSA